MSWQDRPYRESYESGPGSQMPGWVWTLLRWLSHAFFIGRYAGVNVRVHVMFLFLFVGLWLWTGDFFWTLRMEALFFFSVLLHEFGHALACRRVGGQADEILMWPLGGLAFCNAPRRIGAEFITVACGPAVNVVLAIVCFLTVGLWVGWAATPTWNPTRLWTEGYIRGVPGLVVDAFYVNYLLLLFNLLMVFYPFDGGRLVQIALWTQVGRRRSLLIATVVGMVGAVGVAFYGIVVRQLFLIMIAAFGFYACYRQRQMVQQEGVAASLYGGPDDAFDLYGTGDDDEPREGILARWSRRRAQRREAKREQEQVAREQRIDDILRKVSEHGIASLTAREKRTLQNATEAKRRG